MKMAEGNYEAYTKDLVNANEIAKEQRAMETHLLLSAIWSADRTASTANGTQNLLYQVL